MRAISSFSLEAGTSTFCWRERIALRTRVRKSATGSVKFICTFSLPVSHHSGGTAAISFSSEFRVSKIVRACSERETRNSRLFYQLDLETPGISPRSANWRKHRRQIPKRRRKARGRPHSPQRLWRRLVKTLFFARSAALLSRGFSFSFLSFWIFAVVAMFSYLRSAVSDRKIIMPGTACLDAAAGFLPDCHH